MRARLSGRRVLTQPWAEGVPLGDSDAIDAAHPVTLTYDVGLEAGDIPAYIAEVDRAAAAGLPGVTTYHFGHMGDGNLHVMFGGAPGPMADRDRLDRVVYDTLARFPNTTISAEHGIGLEKRAWLDRSRTPAALAAMWQLKRSFDPKGILNPGKILEG